MKLKGKNVLLGITGGIAVYKVCSLVRLLKSNGANVDVVMTSHATEFVSPLTFETLSANPVTTEMFSRERKWEVEHVALAKKADVCVIAPATANIVGKIANGIADDMLSTTVMACKCPLILATAMNTAMLESQAFRDNVETLKKRGVLIVDGDSGFLACGDSGKGRMAEPDVIYSEIEKVLLPDQSLCGKKVLITLGATAEQIDPVRFLSNWSSGKMGCALADEALRRGANVTVVAGRHDVELPNMAEVVNVKSTEDMFQAVKDNLDADVFVMAAAPCDYKIKNYSSQKIKSEQVTLQLEKTVDVAAYVGQHKQGKLLVAFAAETENGEQNARAKLKKKNADVIVLNDVTQQGAGFGCDTNVITIIDADSSKAFDIMTKQQAAKVIFDKIAALL